MNVTELQHWTDEDEETLTKLLFKQLVFSANHKVLGPICTMRGMLHNFKEPDGSLSAINVQRLEAKADEADKASRELAKRLSDAENAAPEGVENEQQQ